MLRIQSTTHLDARLVAAASELISDATSADGYQTLGERKYAQLRVGASSWTGLLAFHDRRLVGYAHLRWDAPGARPRASVEIVVQPDYRGTDCAPRLLEAAQGAVAEVGGGVLYLWMHRVEDPQAGLGPDLGFTVQRDLAVMVRRLSERPQPRPLPRGITLRPYREGVDDAEFLRVNNAAFAGHPEQGGWDAGELADRRTRTWFEAEGLLLAWSGSGNGGELAGFHWTKYHAPPSEEVAGDEPVGEVYVLGVHPSAQGLGLGGALLEAGLAHLYDRGARVAELYVNRADVPAVAMYSASGFKVAYSEVCYETLVHPALPHRQQAAAHEPAG